MNWTIVKFLATCLFIITGYVSFAKTMGPTVDLGRDKSVCVGSSITLDAGNAGSTYQWSMGGAATQTRTVTSATTGVFTYWVGVTDGTGTTYDTVRVEYVPIPTAPTVSPVTTCQGNVNLTATTSADWLIWFNSTTPSTSSFLGFGSPLLYNATGSGSVYPQAWNIGSIAHTWGPTIGNNSVNSTKGIKFDVLSPILFKSVKMYATLAGTVTLELKNSGGQVLKTIVAPLQGNNFLNTVTINVPLYTGNNYSLSVKSLGTTSSLRFYDSGSATSIYPMTVSGLINVKEWLAADAGKYFYFFEPEILEFACSSPQATLPITVQSTPSINFGIDTVACNTTSVSLSMPANGTYNWSTGATTQNITVNSPGGMIVGEITFANGCSDKDTINVLFSTTPTTPTTSNVTTCAGMVSLTATSSANSKIVWRDGNTATSAYLGVGASFNYNATATTTLYTEAYNVSNPINFSYPSLPVVNSGTNVSKPIGLTFDVIRPIILDSVTIYPKNTGQAYIEVQRANGTVVERKLVSFAPSVPYEAVRVGLGFTVLPANGYKLLLYLNESASLNTIKQHIGTFPQQIQGYVKIVGSTSGATTYVGFYDWEVRLLTCPTAKVPKVITVNPIPTINLGRDTVQCGGTISLTMGSSNSSYNPTWKNTSGTSLGTGINLTVNSSNDGTIIAEATQGSCTKRDTINAEILSTPNAPTASNPAPACAGTVTLTANAGTNQVLWWDAASGGNVIGTGTPFTYTTAAGNCANTTTTTLYAQSYATSQFKRNVGLKTAGASFVSAAGTGQRFDVSTGVTVKIDFVNIYAANPGTFILELYNSAGTLLNSKVIGVSGSPDVQKVAVDFIVYEGTDYILKLKNSSIFSLWQTVGTTSTNYYPLSIPGFLTIKSGVSTTSNNVTNRYYGLYDWEVTVYPCGSATRTPVTISTLPTPNVNLGADQITCGSSVTLNAGACSGATFSWMNNTTSQTLTVSSQGITTAAVQVSKTTSGTTCVSKDTVKVNIISSPTLGAMPNLSSCGGAVVLNAVETVPADTVLWWNAATNGNVIAAGNPANYYFTSSQTVYAQGFNAAAINLEVGAKNPNLITTTNTVNRGLVFDVATPLWIEYITVYSQGAGTLNIELQNSGGTVLQQKFVTVTGGYAANEVALGFFVVPGNGYKLRLASTTGGYLYADIANTGFYNQTNMYIFNGTNNDIKIKSAFDGNNSNVSTFYYYFYNWKVRPYRCSSARVPKVVTILPTPVNTLPKDTISCGGSVTLCSPSPGANLTWTITPTSAGTTNASCVTMTSSGTVILKSTYTSVNCSDIDTVQVEISSTPSQLSANDASVCPGEATVIATSDADYVAWFDAPTGGNLVTFGDTAIFYAVSDTVLYVQGYNITQFSNNVGQASWTQNTGNMSSTAGRGLLFDVYKPIIIDTVSIYLNTANPSGSITISLLDKDLNTIANKIFNTWSVQTVGGKYIQKIPLGFFASPNPYGSYRIVLKTNTLSVIAPSDNKLGFEPSNAFPYKIQDALYITAGNNNNNTANLTTYYYFFDWKVRFGACETAPQAVNVTLYPSPTHQVDLGTDFITCGDTVLNPGNYPTGYTFEWNTFPPTYSQSLTITQSGTYAVTVDNLNGCGVADTVNATVNPLPLAAGTVTVGANSTITFNSIGSSVGTLSWTFGGTGTSALAFGNYTYPSGAACNQTVTLYVQNDCGTDNITFPINLCVDIDNNLAQQVNVFPNPTAGVLYIQAQNINSPTINIRLTDMLGREIMTRTVENAANELNTELDLKGIAAGMYQVLISTIDDKTAVKRIVIQK